MGSLRRPTDVGSHSGMSIGTAARTMAFVAGIAFICKAFQVAKREVSISWREDQEKKDVIVASGMISR